MINESQFDEIGSGRVSEILDSTYSSGQSWVNVEMLSLFKDFGAHVG
jgi:hypothetical protein